MTCIHCASSAREPAPAPWLHSDSRFGPRSPRTGWPSKAASGVAPLIATNWMPVSWQDTDLDLLREARALLIEELATRRSKHRSTCDVLAELRAVTHAILAMAVR